MSQPKTRRFQHSLPVPPKTALSPENVTVELQDEAVQVRVERHGRIHKSVMEACSHSIPYDPSDPDQVAAAQGVMEALERFGNIAKAKEPTAAEQLLA